MIRNFFARITPHFWHSPQPPASVRPNFPVAYTRQPVGPSMNAMDVHPGRIAAADYPVLNNAYDNLTGGRNVPVHFVCNGSDASITRTLGHQFMIQGMVTSQPYARGRPDTLRLSPVGMVGQNGNTAQPLTIDQQQMLLNAAKFSLANGYVGSSPFAPDVRLNGL